MAGDEGKEHLSLVLCGHVDAGKSTLAGRLLMELGGISQGELKRVQEACSLARPSWHGCVRGAWNFQAGPFNPAWIMDRLKEERRKSTSIVCTTRDLFTATRHYTVIDVPGQREFIKNMIRGASQADVALVMVPADGNFATAISRGNHRVGEVQGQTRHHARLINLLGVKQIAVCVNKMDGDRPAFQQSRFDVLASETKDMLVKVGWKKDFVERSVPVVPISAKMGDNLFKKSENMAWWNGVDVACGAETVHVDTVYDVLEKLFRAPERLVSAPLRMPISSVHVLTGVGYVVAGRVEQGQVRPGQEVAFLPAHSAAGPCTARVGTVEAHHRPADVASAGDYVGLSLVGRSPGRLPRAGDVVVYRKDGTLGQTIEFEALVQVLDVPKEIRVGYCPLGSVRCGRAPCRLSAIAWKIGKETGDRKVEAPLCLKSGELAQCTFQPQGPLVVDCFRNCEGLGRVALLDGNTTVMLGKVTACRRRDEA